MSDSVHHHVVMKQPMWPQVQFLITGPEKLLFRQLHAQGLQELLCRPLPAQDCQEAIVQAIAC